MLLFLDLTFWGVSDRIPICFNRMVRKLINYNTFFLRKFTYGY
jgi:hypothetical protein